MHRSEKRQLVTDGGTPSTESSRSEYKVDRLIKTYDLAGLGEELESRWTGESGERESLRDLATYFNKRILKYVFNEHDIRPLAGDFDASYNALTNDETSSGVRSELKNRLQRAGVDVDQLESNFVTHQAIHTYLKDFRGASLDDISNETRIEKERDTVQRLRSRTAAVTGDAVTRLESHGLVDVGDFDVIVDVSVVCQDCGNAYSAEKLLEQGQCQCHDTADDQ